MRRGEAMRWLRAVVADPVREGCRVAPWPPSSSGYPKIKIGGRTIQATHLVLEMDGRPRPPGAIALHSCDNPPCLAPWCLSWGTSSRNNAEAYERGRRSRKLSDDDVETIRVSVEKGCVLARRYGVSESLISQIRLHQVRARLQVAH